MRKGIILSLLVAAVVSVGAWLALRPKPSSPAPQPTASLPAASETGDVAGREDTGEGGPAPIHPVSLPAMMEKDIVGSDLVLGAVQAENSAYTRHTVTYRSGDLKISGILNLPKGEGPFPALILNHGYIDPAVYTNGRGLRREQDYLARRGYIVLHSDYRNHAFSDKDDRTELEVRLGYVEDSLAAAKALQASGLPVQKDRIGMLGHSMGGGVTLGALVVAPELIDAAVLFAPVSGDARKNYERWTTRRPERAQRIVEIFGTPEEAPSFWDGVSAQIYYSAIAAPVMIHHGTADESVPLAWSEKLNADLQALQKDVRFHVYDGQPHEFTTAWGTVMERTVEFFDEKLK